MSIARHQGSLKNHVNLFVNIVSDKLQGGSNYENTFVSDNLFIQAF